MTTPEDDWRAVHDPTTSAEELASIAGRHPEFGDAIAQHPHCYPELREWIAAASAPTPLAPDQPLPVEPLPEAPGSDLGDAPPPRKRRLGLIIAAAAAAVVLIGGGGVAWAVVAANSPVSRETAVDEPASSAADKPEPLGERVLDGPPIYVGDELGWFLIDETQATGFFAEAQDFSRNSTVFTVGEREGVHTEPEACWPWFMPDDWPVVGIRSLVWQSPGLGEYSGGAISARQFPDATFASTEWAAFAESLTVCGAFETRSYSGEAFDETTLTVTAQSETGFVVERRTNHLYESTVTTSTHAVIVEGNVVVILGADHSEGTNVDGAALLEVLQQRVEQARTELTEKVGYR